MSNTGRALRGVVLTVLIGLPILLVGSALVYWFALDQPYEANGGKKIEFTVPRGAYIDGVADDLLSSGLVRNTWYISSRFKLLSRTGRVPDLKAGRYSLTEGSRPSELIAALTNPDAAQRIYKEVLLSPGLTAREIAERVDDAGLAEASDVKDAILDLADDYPILPNPEGLQGYLFPDTYQLEVPLSGDTEASKENAETIVRLMADSFFDKLDEIDSGWTNLTRVQLHEKVTLASIVEREYRVAVEAPKIAAVFNNRLNEGMPLQSCATLVYAIQETPEGRPFREEYLRFNRRIFIRYTEGVDSPFNTYLADGLPPGPISIPGYTALEAAFYPADTDALFFVVKDPSAGTHTFTRDYSDHLQARESYLNQYVVKD